MFGSVKKINLGQQPSSPLSDPASCPHPKRRPPSTPPLPLRTLQLIAKQPEIPVVLRVHRKVIGQESSVRESWPGARLTASEPKPKMSERSLTPPSWGQPRTTNQTRPHVTPSAPLPGLLPTPTHPHWSVPVRGRGSEATMMSLLLFCQR